jgi:hypothetical protein
MPLCLPSAPQKSARDLAITILDRKLIMDRIDGAQRFPYSPELKALKTEILAHLNLLERVNDERIARVTRLEEIEEASGVVASMIRSRPEGRAFTPQHIATAFYRNDFDLRAAEIGAGAHAVSRTRPRGNGGASRRFFCRR